MSFANKRNKGRKFDVDTTDYGFIKTKDLEQGTTYQVLGVVVFKTKYGDSPAAILKGTFLSLPKHMADQIYEILEDDTDIKDIKDGNVGIRRRDYTGRDGNEYTGIEWVDLN